MITIKNGYLTVEISEKGAELQSIRDNSGNDFLWSGDPKYWTGRAPVLFPICGVLKNDKFIYEGKEYSLSKHGFAKKSDFTVESASDSEATFLIVSNDETKKMYPFDFEFRARFLLEGKSLKITYSAKNSGGKTMYCSFGAHEAYAAPEGIEEYKVIFDEPETLDSYVLDGNLLKHDYITVMKNSRDFQLLDKYFEVDALVFKNLKSRGVTLAHRDGRPKVHVAFEGFDYFLLWHKHTAPYICIEPWCGVQDPVDSTMVLSEKEGINAVEAGKVFERTHVITIEG